DAEQPFMGLRTTRPGGIIRKDDVSIAKNYLDGDELDALNRIVNAFIEFAELRAMQRKVMTMRDWITKLDELLSISDHELLNHAGKISAEQAKKKAELEYDRYRALMDSQPRMVDRDFDNAIAEVKKLPKPQKPKPVKP
ncbi:MAG TPA: RhuM family protein, partial [Polyangium sp.]|nr:RhuM family protein [Polyangium sp.]